MAKDYDVASILERETQRTIDNWYTRVLADRDRITVSLSRKDRCAHLPEMFSDLVSRLRNPLPLGTRALTSGGARHHGCLRREQGYTSVMLVEESRLLQVSIFETLQRNLEDTIPGVLLLYIMTIADEVDSQLAQAMATYSAEPNADVEALLGATR